VLPLFWDPTYFLLIPAAILALYAQARVRSTYARFSQVRSAAGISGAEAARRLLQANGIHDVSVEEVEGQLSDHYDPRAKVVRLSTANYRTNSLAGLAVAAHEVGHATQHAAGYFPLNFRHAILPVANFGSMAALPLFFIGFFFVHSPLLMDAGILLYAGVVLFQVVTLPVEFNASSRAMAQLVDGRMLAAEEAREARKVLNAAALTYVAATATALMHLVRLLILRGAMRDD